LILFCDTSALVKLYISGTTSPRRCAMSKVTVPIVVHGTSTDDSTPQLPPVS